MFATLIVPPLATREMVRGRLHRGVAVGAAGYPSDLCCRLARLAERRRRRVDLGGDCASVVRRYAARRFAITHRARKECVISARLAQHDCRRCRRISRSRYGMNSPWCLLVAVQRNP